MTFAEDFQRAAMDAVAKHIELLRKELTYESALLLPAVEGRSIVILGREVEFAIFRQSAPPSLPGQVLVTVQIARHALAGMVSFRTERGIVFSPGAHPREATEQELLTSGG